MNTTAVGVLLVQSACSACAAVYVAPLFTDGAVLQRNQPIPVWGHAAAGEKIDVQFAEATVSTVANAEGRWSVFIPPRAASSEPRDLTITGEIDGNKTQIHRRDILVGDVWLCSGQSNIEWPVRLSLGAAEAAATANFPTIRHVKIPRSTAMAPRDEMSLEWKSATPEATPHFSAVAFFFARELQSRIGVPIGLINCTFGGTPIESWFYPEALRRTSAGAEFLKRWDAGWENWYTRFDSFQSALANSAQGAEPLPKPWPPSEYSTPSGAFNGMLYSTIPYALTGVLWYQGESNVGRAADYRELFPALIESWRKHWGQADLPFVFVQLPNYGPRAEAAGTSWAELRDAQAAALALPNTAMVVSVDAGDANDLHPIDKLPIGSRAAALAAANFYDLPGEKSSPILESVAREGANLRLTFSHAGTGLTLREAALSGFEVAGADGSFREADAQVQGDSVVVHCGDIQQPRTVRYAWRNAPVVTLYSQGGLPAAPFSASVP